MPDPPSDLLGRLDREIARRQALELEIVRSQGVKSIGRLAGGVAHAFNNLLTVAQGHLELLLADHAEEPQTVGDLREALKATRRAGELTRNLLSFAGRQRVMLRPLELSSLLQDSLEMVRSVLPASTTLQTLVGENVHVNADPALLRDVLLSLSQFCGERMPGGGMLRAGVTTADLSVPLAVEGGKLPAGLWGVLFVEDSGGPMSQGARQGLFEPFGNGETIPSDSHLGMAAAYGIVEQSGGGIRVDLESGYGARFEVYLARTMAVT